MSSYMQWILSVAIGLLFYPSLICSAHAAPEAQLLPQWLAHEQSSTIKVDHSIWGNFLNNYLVPGSRDTTSLIRYAQVTPEDKNALKAYLHSMSALPVHELNRAEQKAYWINIYNALTVQIILDHYPVSSIRDLRANWFSSGPWDLKLITIAGEKLSLNDIEHGILRPIWQDKRVHYAINCASIGCPNLQPQPFTSENSAQLLDKGAYEFINSQRGVSFVPGKLLLSSIYDWFQADFGADEQLLLHHLAQYAAAPLADKLRQYNGSIDYSYDWRLNSAD